jgi:hypothetical protein
VRCGSTLVTMSWLFEERVMGSMLLAYIATSGGYLVVCFDAYLGSVGIVGGDRVQTDYSEAAIMEDNKSITVVEVTHEEASSS